MFRAYLDVDFLCPSHYGLCAAGRLEGLEFRLNAMRHWMRILRIWGSELERFRGSRQNFLELRARDLGHNI